MGPRWLQEQDKPRPPAPGVQPHLGKLQPVISQIRRREGAGNRQFRFSSGPTPGAPWRCNLAGGFAVHLAPPDTADWFLRSEVSFAGAGPALDQHADRPPTVHPSCHRWKLAHPLMQGHRHACPATTATTNEFSLHQTNSGLASSQEVHSSEHTRLHLPLQ